MSQTDWCELVVGAGRLTRATTKRFAAAVLIAGVLSVAVQLSGQQAGTNTDVLPAYPIGNAFPPSPITTGTSTDATKGDNYLQRQEEPTVAASTYNADHLLAAFNDYRTVAIPNDLALPGEGGASWIGLSRSYDRGKHWYGALVPGFPGGTSSADLNSPLYGLAAGSDPALAVAPGGHFYLGALFFTAGALSNVAVMHLRDVPSLDGGDSIKPGRISIIDKGSAADSGNFVDKPGIAADIPRKTSDPSVCGPAYIAYTVFVGGGDTTPFTSKIGFARSPQGKCGEAWDNVQYLQKNYKQNQGAAVAVDPNSGKVYVVWRHIYQAGGDGAPDSILIASSSDGGSSFTSPAAITGADFAPFDQISISTTTDANHVAFRSNAFPTITVDGAGNVYVAIQEKVGSSTYNEPRITIRTLRAGAKTWTAKSPIELGLFPGGQQVMPSLSFSGGLLKAIWYDFRKPEWVTNDPAWGHPSDCDTSGHCYITGLDRRMETRLAQTNAQTLDANGNPQFSDGSVSITNYRSNRLLGGLPSVNRPNLPLYVGGTTAHTGDYISVTTGSAFVATPGAANPFRWATNVDDYPARSSLAAWADTRDVVFPLNPSGSPDLFNITGWTQYAPPGTGASCVNPGSRNQNVYFSEVKPGVIAGSPSTSRQLVDGSGHPFERAFPFYVQNTTFTTRYFRLTFQANSTTTPVAGSFSQGTATTATQPPAPIDVTVLPISTVSKTVYAYCATCTSSNAFAPFSIKAQEITAVGGTLVSGGLTTQLRFNSDPTAPYVTNPNLATSETHDISVTSADWANADWANADWANADWANADWANADWANADWANADWANADWANADWANTSPVGDLVTSTTNVGNNSSAYSVSVTIDPTLASNLASQGYKAALILSRSYNKPNSFAQCAVQPIPLDEVISVIPLDLTNVQSTLLDTAAFAAAPVASTAVPAGSSSGTAAIESDQVFVVLRFFGPRVNGAPAPALTATQEAAISAAVTTTVAPQAGDTASSATSATTTTLSTSPASGAVYGQTVTFTAHVTPRQATLNGGTVSFNEVDSTTGATLRLLGNVPVDLSTGNASIGVSNFSVGTHAVSARFNGTTTLTWSSASISLTVAKAPATVTLSNLTQTYDGTAKFATATTIPAGLQVSVAYSQNGAAVAAPTNAGSYGVLAVVTDSNYAGSASGLLTINNATATLTMSNLVQAWDGTPKPVTVTTSPANLTVVTVTYTGATVTYGPSTTAPSEVGSYTVTATLTNDNYQADPVTDTLAIFTPQSVTQFGFNGLLSPYQPPPATFNSGRAIPVSWQYTDLGTNAVIGSSGAMPSVQITGPYACSAAEGGTIQLITPGNSDLQYLASTNTWQVNWQSPMVTSPLCFSLRVTSGATSQTNGPFVIELTP